MTEKTIIRQLFYGELHPCERFVHPKSEIRKTSKNIGNMAEKMIDHLSEADAEQLQEIIDELYHYSSLLEADAFESGFRLGAKMMIEILYLDGSNDAPGDDA